MLPPHSAVRDLFPPGKYTGGLRALTAIISFSAFVGSLMGTTITLTVLILLITWSNRELIAVAVQLLQSLPPPHKQLSHPIRSTIGDLRPGDSESNELYSLTENTEKHIFSTSSLSSSNDLVPDLSPIGSNVETNLGSISNTVTGLLGKLAITAYGSLPKFGQRAIPSDISNEQNLVSRSDNLTSLSASPGHVSREGRTVRRRVRTRTHH